jgi:isopentenyl diphosphate isomerase/L-lactate dehydrogenase-like FMN-dependent dehydrogenase
MEKEFIPYEQALALKELGFDEPCFGYYNNLGRQQFILSLRNLKEDNNDSINYFSAPLYQQAFRWFREKYHIVGEVKFKGGKTTKTAWYDYVIYSEIDWNDENLSEQWKKHEAAELACLKKLIEIVKNK